MDIIRNKKRTFFSISDIQSSFKKKSKNGSTSSDILPTTREGFPVEEDNVFSSSDDSSSQDEQESSDEDNHKISRKQKSLARQATRRDKKREMQHLKKKDKNKISMEDFLSKQTEFNNWLEEEKHKDYRDMSSPKRKIYFKTFLKLWNKRKLPQKYYRGSTVDIDSPTPVQFNLFEEPAENSQLTAIKRPKSKRLSVEQAGFLDSPFSTFGKTPPKLLQHTSLDALDGKENVTPVLPKRSTFGPVSSPRCQSNRRKDQVSPILELSEYQIPLNSVRVGETLREDRNGKRMVAPYSVTSYPWTDSDASSLKSDLTDEDDHVIITQHQIKDHVTTAVYAVPMKAKGAKCLGQGLTNKADNFHPPPVPPKPSGGFSGGYATVDICGYKSIAPHQKHNVTCDSSSSDSEAHFMLPPSTPNGGYATVQLDQDDFPPPPPEMIEEGSPDNSEPSEEFPSPPLQFKDKIKPPSPQKPKRSPYTRLTSKPLNIPVVNHSKSSVNNAPNLNDDDVHYVKMLPVSSVLSGSPVSLTDDSLITEGKSLRSISTVPGNGNTRREYSSHAQLSVSVDSGVSECSMLTRSDVPYIENKSNSYWKGYASSQYADLDELKMEMFGEEDSKSETSSEIKNMKFDNEHEENAKSLSNVDTENTMKIHPKKSLIETEEKSSNLEKYSFEHKGQFGSLSPFICTRRRKIKDKKPAFDQLMIDDIFSVTATSKDEGSKREEDFVSNKEQLEVSLDAVVPECPSLYNESFEESCTRSPRNPSGDSCKETMILTKSPQIETDENSINNSASLHPGVFASSRQVSKVSDLDNVPPQAAHVSLANRGPEESGQSARGESASNDIKRSKLQGSENSCNNDQTLGINPTTVDNAEVSKIKIQNLPSIQEKQKKENCSGGTGIAVKCPRKQSSKLNNTENQLEISISPQEREGYLETDIDSLTSTSDEGNPNNGLKRCQSLETVIW